MNKYRLALFAFALVRLAHAGDTVPTALALNSALAAAREAWGQSIAEPVEFRFDPLNSCAMRASHQIAVTQILDTWTTLTVEGEAPVTTHQFRYIIRLNANCNWNKLDLSATITHEYGHILIGTDYHSQDKHSIMNWLVGGAQTITDADRRALERKRGGEVSEATKQ
jgi:hypothetical protein